MITPLQFFSSILLVVLVLAAGPVVSADHPVHEPARNDEYLLPPPAAVASPTAIQPHVSAGKPSAKLPSQKTVDRSAIISPASGSNIQANTTFRWSDEGAEEYLFRLSAVGCFQGDIVNQFGIPGDTTSFTATELETSGIIFASLFARPVGDGFYRSRNCAIYNADIDSDGIYNELDPNPSIFDPSKEYLLDGQRLTVLPTGRVAVLRITPTQYDQLSNGNTSSFDDITNVLYSFYQDSFDFIFITNDQDSAPARYLGVYNPVQNDVSGLGRSIFNSTSRWGSDDPSRPGSNDGRLQGAIHFPDLRSFSSGPGLHELAHRWANFTDSIPAGNTGSHWGYSSGGGQLGGWAPATLGDPVDGVYTPNNGVSSSFGLVANGGNSVPYSNIELYLMGMIPANELSTMQYAVNPAPVAGGGFTADSIVTVTPQQIIATEGVRSPSSVNAQKNFSVLNVIVTTSSVSRARLGKFDEEAFRFGLNGDDGRSSYNFWEATGARGTLDMTTALNALKPGLIEIEPSSSDLCVPITAKNQKLTLICL